MRGYGYAPYYVEGDDPDTMHQRMAAVLDDVFDEIRRIQTDVRTNGFRVRPCWPMIVLRSPKGWTGPKVVDGKPVEGTWRAHQVPLAEMATHPGHVTMLEEWMRGYRPEELFDEHGKLRAEIAELAPEGERRMSANPVTGNAPGADAARPASCRIPAIAAVEESPSPAPPWPRPPGCRAPSCATC